MLDTEQQQEKHLCNLRNMRDLYEGKGDLREALRCSRELMECLDEYLEERSRKEISLLKVEFDTEKKEKEAEINRLRNVELKEMNEKLRDALAHVKRLKGLLPVCSHCKKVRDDDGYWKQIESYLSDHMDSKFSQGICPECYTKLYGRVYTKETE